MHTEQGSYNKVYRSKEYTDNTSTFFPVLMQNYGIETFIKRSESEKAGIGYVRTIINEGSVYNLDHYEVQPYTEINIPYVFCGTDMGIIGLEIGISYYLVFKKYEGRRYLNSDGSVSEDDADIRLDQKNSTVFPNFLIRIFPENKYHFKLALSRGRFNAVDSLLTASFIYPVKNHSAEFFYSLPADIPGFLPGSNQRTGLAYSYTLFNVTLGFTGSYLSFNHAGGGDGNMPLFDINNFSCGIFLEMLL